MERYLITQSLLSSWAYIFNAYEGYEEDAMESFLSTLRREPSEPTEAMLDGIDFENAVYRLASGDGRYLETSPSCLNGKAAYKLLQQSLSGRSSKFLPSGSSASEI